MRRMMTAKICVVAMTTIMMATWHASAADNAFVVKGVECHVAANGAKVDAAMMFSFAPTEEHNAVVMVNDEMIIDASETGSFLWMAETNGTNVMTHAVGDVTLSATYVVTNGYAKAKSSPKVPMDRVEGITLSTNEFSVSASRTIKRIKITGNGVDWTAETSADWLNLSAYSGTVDGTTTISCTAEANPSAESRVGYAYIAGQIITVTQAGLAASLDKTLITADCSGLSEAVQVTTDEATPWIVTSDASWISVSPQTGTGSASVTLQVAPWSASGTRSGTLTIAGQTVTVTQTGTSLAYPTTTTAETDADGTSGSFAITASKSVTWTATSDADWLVVDESSRMGRGTETISWTAEAQSTLTNRTATITVTPSATSGFESWTFTVTQMAADFVCPTETSTTVAASEMSEFATLAIATADGVAWTATSDADWLVVNGGGETRFGSGDVEWKTLAQTSDAPRTATITVQTMDTGDDRTWTFTVTQAAAMVPLSATSAAMTAVGGTVSVEVGAADGVCWTVGELPDWITLVQEVCGVGAETVSFNVATNASFEARSATILIAGSEFVVTQSAAQMEIVGGLTRLCKPDVDSCVELIITVRVDVADASWTIAVESAASDWVLVDGKTARTGSDNFTLQVWTDDGVEFPRTANVAIGNQVLTIVQSELDGYSAIRYANLKGAANTNPSFYQEGTDLTLTAPGAVDGYTFAGWTPSAITVETRGDLTVTANWTANNYTIKYDANGGEGVTDATACTYDAEGAVASNGFTRKGYKFLGWATEKDGAVVYEAGAKVSNLVSTQGGSVTLYAVWERLPMAISDVKVTSIAPWGLAIDYQIENADEDVAANLVLNVSAVVDGVTNVAQTVAGETNCVNGAHRVYWDMAADGLSFADADAEVVVSYARQTSSAVTPLYCVIDLSGGANTNKYQVEYLASKPAGGFNATEYKTTKLVLRRVEYGSSPFYMALFETTQRQWESVTGSNPCLGNAVGSGDMYPVHYLSYTDIRGGTLGLKWPSSDEVDETSFLFKLRNRTGIDTVDLPTEAQWEYACRAGTTTLFSYGDTADGDYMWYVGNSGGTAHEVGLKKPNDWGFYDMHGNVWEWCLDRVWSSGSNRVLRGGVYGDSASGCSSSVRGELPPSDRSNGHGFRLTCTGPDVIEVSNTVCVVSSSVSNVKVSVIADGGDIAGRTSLSYAPHGSTNAIVTVDGVKVVDSAQSGVFSWYPRAVGKHTLVHTVGDVSLAATYNVTEVVAVSDPVPAVAADATQETVAAALDGAADERLAEKLIDATKYTAYRAWVDGVAGTDLADVAVVAKRQAIKDAAHAWLGYVLDLGYDAAVALDPKQGDLVVATFTISAAGDGTPALPSGTSGDDAWTLTVALDGVSVGANATAANLAEAFVVEGATTLDDAAFSSSSVTATFAPTGDGTVSIAIKPTDATAQTFFIRVRLMP